MSQPNADSQATMTAGENPFLNGERVVVEQVRILPYASVDGSLSFERQTRTLIRGMGQLDTYTQDMSVILPEGTKVSNAEDITHSCSKYHGGKTRGGCGPMTKDRVYWCSRCKRPFCARHTWQPIFSVNRHCWWCLCIRAIELALRITAFCFTGIARALGWGLKSWCALFNR